MNWNKVNLLLSENKNDFHLLRGQVPSRSGKSADQPFWEREEKEIKIPSNIWDTDEWDKLEETK